MHIIIVTRLFSRGVNKFKEKYNEKKVIRKKINFEQNHHLPVG